MKKHVFYDGSCPMCYSFVKLVLARRRNDKMFLFSQINGRLYRAIEEKLPQKIPDSIVIYLKDEEVILLKSEAIASILKDLTWPWRALSFALKCCPRSVADLGYDVVAKLRKKFRTKAVNSCPTIPPAWRKFFVE